MVFLTKYYSSDTIRDYEMGGACDACGEKRVSWGSLAEGEDLGVDRGIIFKWTLNK